MACEWTWQRAGWAVVVLVVALGSSCASLQAYVEGRDIRFSVCSQPVDGPIQRVLDGVVRAAEKNGGVAQVVVSNADRFEVNALAGRVVGTAMADGKIKLGFQVYDHQQMQWRDEYMDDLACAVADELDPVRAKAARSEATRKERAIMEGQIPPEQKYFGKREAILGDGPIDYLLAADVGFRMAGGGNEKQKGAWEQSGVRESVEMTIRSGLLFSLDYELKPSSYSIGYSKISEYLIGVNPDLLFVADRFLFAPGVNFHYRTQWTESGDLILDRTVLESLEFGAGALIDDGDVGAYVRFTYSTPPWLGGYIRLDFTSLNDSPGFGIGFGYELHPKGVAGVLAGAVVVLIVGVPLAYYLSYGGELPFPNPP